MHSLASSERLDLLFQSQLSLGTLSLLFKPRSTEGNMRPHLLILLASAACTSALPTGRRLDASHLSSAAPAPRAASIAKDAASLTEALAKPSATPEICPPKRIRGAKRCIGSRDVVAVAGPAPAVAETPPTVDYCPWRGKRCIGSRDNLHSGDGKEGVGADMERGYSFSTTELPPRPVNVV
ncbi:hypothetical protein EJ04DRAFT_13319 [Polyplosphaeria fusca]|uniref:Uncharacterized protein n=1 Tax=Polyplosphaeria fusca TaxID=682080 RepID=A0A9P4UZU0_9PLEO|nr:hypothetical protein EJ04DRAFT_13319 [Polyplosphaeria fusca]